MKCPQKFLRTLSRLFCCLCKCVINSNEPLREKSAVQRRHFNMSDEDEYASLAYLWHWTQGPDNVHCLMKSQGRRGGRTGKIMCKYGGPRQRFPYTRAPWEPQRDPGPPRIDFLPFLDLSIVGSLFNLAINWESSGYELFYFLPVRMRDLVYDALCIKYK